MKERAEQVLNTMEIMETVKKESIASLKEQIRCNAKYILQIEDNDDPFSLKTVWEAESIGRDVERLKKEIEELKQMQTALTGIRFILRGEE